MTFWYVGTPYTDYHGGHQAAWMMACRVTARLMASGVQCFSPIVHSHPISAYLPAELRIDHDYWQKADAPLMEAAGGIIVVKAEGWRASRGLSAEIRYFHESSKRIVYWNPEAEVPDGLRPRSQ